MQAGATTENKRGNRIIANTKSMFQRAIAMRIDHPRICTMLQQQLNRLDIATVDSDQQS